jgi:DNA-binding transcriptional ArsR family regulator
VDVVLGPDDRDGKVLSAHQSQGRRMSAPRQPSAETLSRLTELLALLADETRLRVVLALAHEGEMSVSALQELTGQSQSPLSNRLTRMRLAGWVSYRRAGKKHLYRLEWAALRDVLDQFFAQAGGSGRELRLGDGSLVYRRGS